MRRLVGNVQLISRQLAALKIKDKKRKGQFSIRINDQFRICFKWSETGPFDVEITDYH